VPRDRDPFAQFERMRREMDALFGDVFDRRLTRHGGGFSPAVDVWYTSEPPRAWVRAELAGINPDDVALEIRGRELILSGRRQMESPDQQRAYQQLEIEHGRFRRVVALGVDVDPEAAIASYEDGLLLVELPVARPRPARTVPVQTVRRDDEP
jgi:HSP20 family protein